MLVKFLKVVAGSYGTFEAGQTADLPAEYAQPMIASGAVIALGGPIKSAPKAERATLPKKPTERATAPDSKGDDE